MKSKDVRIFIRLAESCSFKDAAAHLHLSRATVSKRIAALEAEFDTVLINRSSRGVSLTQTGLLLLEQCRQIRDAEDIAAQAIRGHGLQPVGTLKVALPTPLSACLYPALIREFAQIYPKVTLSVHFVDGEIDVIGEGFDLAIKLARKLDDSNLTAQRLLTTPQVVVASPGYLGRHGTPTNVGELSVHDCLGFGHVSNSNIAWRFVDDSGVLDVNVKYAMTSNSYLALNLAACLDMGLLYVPKLFVNSDIRFGRLKEVLFENTRLIEWGLFAIYPNRQSSLKLKALIDFIKARLSVSEQVDRWAPLLADDQRGLASFTAQ